MRVIVMGRVYEVTESDLGSYKKAAKYRNCDLRIEWSGVPNLEMRMILTDQDGFEAMVDPDYMEDFCRSVPNWVLEEADDINNVLEMKPKYDVKTKTRSTDASKLYYSNGTPVRQQEVPGPRPMRKFDFGLDK